MIVTNRLSQPEVRRRLQLCTEPTVIDEVYEFGQKMLTETIVRTRLLDTKAGSMAAYGAAIVTLLVSTSGTWSRLGNKWTPIVAALAGLAAFIAVIFSVWAMALRNFNWLSEEEWLQPACLSDVKKLKRYRALTIWGAMDSYKTAHVSKVNRLKIAERTLLLSVFFLLIILLQFAWLYVFYERFGVKLGQIVL